MFISHGHFMDHPLKSAWPFFGPRRLLSKYKCLSEFRDVLVVPLHPTRKSEFPFADMADYITWLQPTTTAQDLQATPFDPWLRKHTRLGAQSKRYAKWESEYGWLPLELNFPRDLVPLQYYVQEDNIWSRT